MESNSCYSIMKRQFSNVSLVLSELDSDDSFSDIPSNIQNSSAVRKPTDIENNKKESQLNIHPDGQDNRVCPAEARIGKLVTTNIEGKEYVLPFKLLSECVAERLLTKNSHKLLNDSPPEGLDFRNPTLRDEIVSLLFAPVQQELVLKKTNLCGDYSVGPTCKAKCHSEIPSPNTSRAISNREDKQILNKSPSVSSAKVLKLDRTPFQCPISKCGDFVSATFYSSHLKVEHSDLTLGGLHPGEERTILVNLKLNVHGSNHCNAVYYLHSKLRDFGQSEFRNLVPVLLMSSKFQLIDLKRDARHGQHVKRSSQASKSYYVFWFTGIVSESMKIHYSLEIGARQWNHGWIYPLSGHQDLKSVFWSGAGLMFSQKWINKFITRQDKFLEMRLVLR
ncbi:uncharacterized protein LOC134214680 [Armigeres subalbatus]|uniref:uncharacterized protein LOC134214680 n=1 Tax=Armigeres subalbatus TaxID=124917 RepID=UPI002ED02CC8